MKNVLKSLLTGAACVGLTLGGLQPAHAVLIQAIQPIAAGAFVNPADVTGAFTIPYTIQSADTTALVIGYYNDGDSVLANYSFQFAGEEAVGFVAQDRAILSYHNITPGLGTFDITGTVGANNSATLGATIWELSAVDLAAGVDTGSGGTLTTTTANRFVISGQGINGNGTATPGAGSILSFANSTVWNGGTGGALVTGSSVTGAPGGYNVSWNSTGGNGPRGTVAVGLVSAPSPGTWRVNGNGLWSNAANWAGGLPASGGTATFDATLTPANAPATITLDVNANLSKLVFGNTSRYIIGGSNTLTLSGGGEVNVLTGTHEIKAPVAGALNKTGNGTIILSGAYTGAATATAGALSLGAAAANPSSVTLNGGSLHFTEGYVGTYANNITGAGQFRANEGTAEAPVNVFNSVVLDASLGSNTVTFTGTKGYTGITQINGGTLAVSNPASLGTTSNMSSDRTSIGAGNGKLQISGGAYGEHLRLTGRTTALGTADNVHLSSTASSTWSGNIKGEGTAGNFNIESTAGTLTLGGTLSGGVTANYVFSGAGNFDLTGKITDGTTDNNGVFTTPSATASVSVVKRGAGTLTVRTPSSDPLLTFDDRWQNGTTVEGGTLEVIAATGNVGELYGPLAVRAGATLDVDSFSNYSLQPSQALSGGGTVQLGAGSLVLYDDNSLSPGDPAVNGGVGTLKISGNASLNSDVVGGGILTFQLSDNPAAQAIDNAENDLINVSGNLSVSGAPAWTFNISPTEGGLGVGTYKLIDYAGSNTITLGTTTVNYQSAPIAGEAPYAVQSRQTLALAPAAGQLNLSVTGAAAASLVWTGIGTQVWDVAGDSGTNWSGADSKFYDFDSVTFNDSSNVNTIAIGALVTPGATTFNSATGRTYTFGGGDSAATPANNVGFRGLGPINLTGNVNVVLDNWQNRIHGAVSLGAGTSLKLGSTTLVTVNPSTEIFGVISGSGAISIDEGTHGFHGANTFTSNLVINGGTLDMDNATALGTAAGKTTINAGGTLVSTNDTYTTQEPLEFNGGTLSVTTAGANATATPHLAGPITVLAGGATITTAGTATLNIDSTVSGAGPLNVNGGAGTVLLNGTIASSGTLTKTAGGVLSLAGTGSITSPEVRVDGGTLNVVAKSNFTVGSGQTLGVTTIRVNNTFGNVQGNTIAASGSTIRAGSVGLETVDGAPQPAEAVFNGDLTLQAGSTVMLDISTPILSDLLRVEGGAVLGGTLDVNLVSGSPSPMLGDTFTVARFVNRMGQFSSLDLPTLGSGLQWNVNYGAKTLDLVVAEFGAGVPGDFNGDNMVDAADYTVWRDGLGTTYTAGDYDIWVANYGTGTAQTDQGATAPEPAAIALLALGALGFSVRRRAAG